MKRERIYLFDTTLRDGAQTEGVDFSVEDKRAISEALDRLGIDYIEGGWPGANPGDTAFFEDAPKLKKAKLTSFGMTKRPGRSADNDPGLVPVMNAEVDAVCLVGKTWDFHVDVALNITNEENIGLISESIEAIIQRKREALFDAEHFFDGYKANSEFAMACLKAAFDAGARWIVLCDTNGGTLPEEVEAIVTEVAKEIPGDRLAIHCHNDTDNAVANSLAAVRAGARMVQGTLNGLGERCGNANLVSIIPTLVLKPGICRQVRDRCNGGKPALPDGGVTHAGRAAQSCARPPCALCRRGGVRPQGRPACLGCGERPTQLRAYPAGIGG